MTATIATTGAFVKRCGKCGLILPVENFSTNGSPARRYSTCRPCAAKRANEWYWKHRDAQVAKRAAHYRANRTEILAKQKANRDRYRERRRASGRKHRLWSNYGITQEEYDALLAAQNGVCAICCAIEESERWSVFHVDHSHRTGRVRGLLCSSCNRGLGYFHDDPAYLEGAAAYLRRTEPNA